MKINTMFANRKLKRVREDDSVSACLVGKIGSSVSIVNLGKSVSLYK